MTRRVAGGTGLWSAAGTWHTVTNTPTLHASTNITWSTSNVFTATFTAPNTSNACVGVLFYVTTVGGAGTITVTLQESTVDTAASVSIAVTSLQANTWLYLTFAAPYTFTTTAAGAYRFKIVNAGPSGSTTVAADSGGSNPMFLAVDNRTGVLAATDDIYIVSPNQAGTCTVTMDGTQTIGSGADTTTVTSARSIGMAIVLGYGATLVWDTTADATLTCKGSIRVDGTGATLAMGTVATPMPAARTARLRFDENGVSGNYGIGSGAAGNLIFQGASKTYFRTTYSSGTGIAADPFIVADAVDWSVGDELLIAAASDSATNYNESETRFIITKNAATSYVLSSTAGGAEAALTYTHAAGCLVLNTTRNVVIDTTNTAHGWWAFCAHIAGSFDADWARFETLGASLASKEGLTLSNQTTGSNIGLDYCVMYRNLRRGWIIASNPASLTFTGLIGVLGSGTGGGGTFEVQNAARNKTFVRCAFVANGNSGVRVQAANSAFTDCHFVANNRNNGVNDGGVQLNSANLVTITNCQFHANRVQALSLNGSTDVIGTDCLLGTKGVNSADLGVGSGTYNRAVLRDSTVNSAVIATNYLSGIPGSEIALHTYNGIANNHRWYTAYGFGQSVGAGLTDTLVRTAGSLAARLGAEEGATGFTWEFNILAKAASIVNFFGYLQRNSTLGAAAVTVELWLPGSTAADASYTLPTTTDTWLPVVISAEYAGTVDLLATVKINVKTTTAGAYLYVDDLYNAGTSNKIAGLDTWNDGKPVNFVVDTTFDPASVWSFALADLTAAGTTGKQLRDTLTVAKFVALK